MRKSDIRSRVGFGGRSRAFDLLFPMCVCACVRGSTILESSSSCTMAIRVVAGRSGRVSHGAWLPRRAEEAENDEDENVSAGVSASLSAFGPKYAFT